MTEWPWNKYRLFKLSKFFGVTKLLRRSAFQITAELTIKRHLIFSLPIIFFLTYVGFKSEGHANESYIRSEIVEARYGKGKIAEILARAYHFADDLNETIVGQEIATQIMQNRLVQFLESYPKHLNEPTALHLIGLPGTGKTAMIQKLRTIGMQVIEVDAQKYLGDEDFVRDNFEPLLMAIKSQNSENPRPCALIIEEIDKLPEIQGPSSAPVTHRLIGQLNEILSTGQTNFIAKRINLSNFFVVTTMNFSPGEIEFFAQDALNESKDFYDFKIEDFQSFYQWINNDPRAKYKILSHLFRSNTVSRLAPNAVVMHPLSYQNYRSITNLMIQKAIDEFAGESESEKRVSVTYSESFLDHLTSTNLYAPSGARETVTQTLSMTRQLIAIGIKTVSREHKSSIFRPRKIYLDYNPYQKQTELTVTPMKAIRGKLQEEPSFTFALEFDPSSHTYLSPNGFVSIAPVIAKKAKTSKLQNDLTPSKKQITATRYPSQKLDQRVNSLEKFLDNEILGQSDVIHLVSSDLNRFLNSNPSANTTSNIRVLSGFPGIGKSELVKKIGSYLDLPVVRLNMQQFSSPNEQNTEAFYKKLEAEIKEVTNDDPNKKFILLLEELDKIFEIDPKTGNPVNRPVMAYIKDLLSDDKIDESKKESAVFESVKQNSFTFITMNFAVDLFGFQADPRLTSFEDVARAWAVLSTHPADTKSTLAKIFLPETVNRIFSRFTIMRPLGPSAYAQLIKKRIDQVISQRLSGDSKNNLARTEIKISDAYRAYIYSESVIPSEGARNTVLTVERLVLRDMNYALNKIPKKSSLRSAPIKIQLDFDTSTSSVLIEINDQNHTSRKNAIRLTEFVDLLFPPLSRTTPLSEDLVLTSAHEFGHAYVASRLGLRFKEIIVVSPKTGIGGMVRFNSRMFFAEDIMASIYVSLASRALERIVLSPKPLDPKSVLKISLGPTIDISMATKKLYEMLYLLGMNPQGGTIDLNAKLNGSAYASFDTLPQELIDRLGLILRDMENFIVRDLMSEHSQIWYIEKIKDLAKKGLMNEKEFYQLIQMTYPGDLTNKTLSFGRTSYLRRIFSDFLETEPKEIVQARSQVEFGRSVQDRLNEYSEFFLEILEKYHSVSGTDKKKSKISSRESSHWPTKNQLNGPHGQCEALFDSSPQWAWSN